MRLIRYFLCCAMTSYSKKEIMIKEKENSILFFYILFLCKMYKDWFNLKLRVAPHSLSDGGSWFSSFWIDKIEALNPTVWSCPFNNCLMIYLNPPSTFTVLCEFFYAMISNVSVFHGCTLPESNIALYIL